MDRFLTHPVRPLHFNLIQSVLIWAFIGSFCNDEIRAQLPQEQNQQLASINNPWDNVFTTRQGWTGGEGGGTIALGNDRILWMFADSFIGGVVDGKHAPGSHMINNVFAVQTLGDRRKPHPQEFEFAWGPDGPDGKPTAWLAPNPTIMSRARQLQDNSKPHGWFWPAGGGCVVDIDGHQRLFVFLFHMGLNGQGGVWGFENIGGALAVVKNPGHPIGQWNVKQLDLPFTKDALPNDAYEVDAFGKDGLRASDEKRQTAPQLETNWGLSCVHVKSDNQADDLGFVYVYGDQHRRYKQRQLILARVRPDEIENFSSWEFFGGKQDWVDDPDQARPIADQIGAEFSIEQVEFKGETKFVMVHSHHWFGTQIFVRTATAPEGPWSKPLAVYDVPEVKKSKNYFTYAARGHALLSPRDELLITYIVNSTDFWEMAGDTSIYRPRCISVPLQLIFDHQ